MDLKRGFSTDQSTHWHFEFRKNAFEVVSLNWIFALLSQPRVLWEDYWLYLGHPLRGVKVLANILLLEGPGMAID